MGAHELAGDTLNISVPEHIAEAFNQGTIDDEDLIVQSANFYCDEVSKLERELQIERLKNQSILDDVKKHAGRVFELENQLKSKSELETKLYDAQSKLLNLNSASVKINALTELLEEKTEQVNQLQDQVAELKPLQGKHKASSSLVDSLKEQLAKSESKVNSLESENRILNNKLKSNESAINDLRNATKPLQKEIQIANEAKQKAYAKLEESENEYKALLDAREADFKTMEETKQTVFKIIEEVNSCNKNVKLVAKENKVLSLLVHSMQPSRVLRTPSGHTLLPYLLDEQQVRQKGGKVLDTAVKDTPVFLWINPNGFACTISLHHDIDSDKPDDFTLLMPSLTMDGAGHTPQEAEILTKVTSDISPSPEHYEEIAEYLNLTSSKALKETFLKHWAQANMYIEKHGLISELEQNYNPSAWQAKLNASIKQMSASTASRKKVKSQKKKLRRK